MFLELIPAWGLLPAIAPFTIAIIIASQALWPNFWPKIKVACPAELCGHVYAPWLN